MPSPSSSGSPASFHSASTGAAANFTSATSAWFPPHRARSRKHRSWPSCAAFLLLGLVQQFVDCVSVEKFLLQFLGSKPRAQILHSLLQPIERSRNVLGVGVRHVAPHSVR